MGKDNSFVFYDDVVQIIEKEYPEIVNYEDGLKLFSETHSLVEQLCLQSKPIQKIVLHKNKEFGDLLREELEQEIILIGESD